MGTCRLTGGLTRLVAFESKTMIGLGSGPVVNCSMRWTGCLEDRGLKTHFVLPQFSIRLVLKKSFDVITKALMDRGEGAQTVQNHIPKCFKHCEIKGLEYRKSCPAGLRVKSATTDDHVKECIQSCQFNLEELFKKRHNQPNNHMHLALVDILLRRRQYNALKHILQHSRSFLPLLKPDVCDIARLLAKNGFAKLLGALIDSKYGTQTRSETSASYAPVDPLLIAAVTTQLPYMDVVRSLVVEAQVDLNAGSRTGEEAYLDADGPGACYDVDVRQPGLNTALFEYAKGFNWW